MPPRPRKAALTLTDPGQLRALGSPAGASVFEALMARGSATAGEIASDLGRPPGTVHYHLAGLVRAGLVRACGERPTGRRPSRVFEPVSTELRTPARSPGPGYDRERARLARLTLARAGREVSDAVLGPHPAEARTCRQLVRLDDAAWRELQRRLDALESFLRDADTPGAAREVSLTIGLAPRRA